MKVYLDDVRKAPQGWILVKTPQEVINYLKTGKVKEISLDHDLGLAHETGYDVILWMEEAVFDRELKSLPKINIHTANPVGYRKMYLGALNVKEIYNSYYGG